MFSRTGIQTPTSPETGPPLLWRRAASLQRRLAPKNEPYKRCHTCTNVFDPFPSLFSFHRKTPVCVFPRNPQRGTPSKNRSFFSTSGGGGAADSKTTTPRTPADVSWIREQAGTTPRALDRDFLGASPSTAAADGTGGAAKPAASSATTTGTATKGKMFNRRTWTKEENEQLQQGMASLGGPDATLGKNVRAGSMHSMSILYTQRAYSSVVDCARRHSLVRRFALGPFTVKGLCFERLDTDVCRICGSFLACGSS